MSLKQVIVVRKDLNMRKGKMIAQGCHASLGAYNRTGEMTQSEWESEGQTKIAVGVNSEKELIEAYQKACEAGLPTCIITDSGRTEFDGVPTKTAVAIGPAAADKIDKITGSMSLL